MNRNTEEHFSNVPRIHQHRSKFNMSHSIKTTFNVGEIIPLMVDADILPGDTVQMDMAEIVRMATPIFPVMDNMVLDTYFFFVPNRLLWDNWQRFWGENDDPWTQTTEYEVPQIESPQGGWAEGTIADYMGLPTYVDEISVNALPFRAYAKVFNDWFRDENLMSNCHIYTDEVTRTGSNGTTRVTDAELGGMPAKVSKLHDYFTSALPNPQKGPEVSIPLGTTAPVRTGEMYNYTNGEEMYNMEWVTSKLQYTTNPSRKTEVYNAYPLGSGNQYGINGEFNPFSAQNGIRGTNGGKESVNTDTSYTWRGLAPANLQADLSDATAATINQLRTAFAIQKYYEAAGRNGTRYIEYLRSVFGVESSDARLQRSEYLGGKRIPINVDQVLQTSATDSTSPQGNTGAFSCTIDQSSLFTKSFEEHGTLLCLVVARVEHSYQQGIDKMWSRKKWTDFYNPYFANLGEMAILNKEIYAQGNNVTDLDGNIIDDQAFGYQEAWAEYRYKQNRVTGHMRSNSPSGSLDSWHYADDYHSRPTLSSGWIEEPKENVDRTIAVTSEISNQFIGDFYFKTAYTRCMPVYSIPGLIDHV